MNLGRNGARLAAAGCLILLAGATGAAEPLRLTLAHGAGVHVAAHTLFLKPWAQRLSIASAGRLAVRIETSDGKTAHGRLVRRLAAGEIDLLWAPLDALPDGSADSEVFELPFMAWPAEAASQAALAFQQPQDTASRPETVAIFLHTDAPFWLHMARRPARRPEDLRGQRLYAPTRSLRALIAQAGGEAVEPEDPAALAAMLSRGELDGAILSFAAAASLGVVEATRYHTRLDRPPTQSRARRPGLATQVHVLAMNARRFRDLPEDARKMLLDSAGRALAESAGRTWDSLDRLTRRRARAEGHVFYQVTDAELRDWHAAARPVIEAWTAEAAARGRDGAELLRRARALIARYYVLMAEEVEARTRPKRDKGG
jgi:TRAP-type C4-dicarboxylate transport system substrate-binding protein